MHTQMAARLLALKQLVVTSTQVFADQKKLSNPLVNHFRYGVHMIPHPEKAAKGGEDAYYVHPKLLSVADGVGGWASHGIDPGKYSKQYCKNVGMLFEKDPKKYLLQPKELLKEAHKITNEIGSTTAVLLTVDDAKAVIYSSYIGDSGYAIYRKRDDGEIEIVHKSEEQQKGFNFPYQIGSEGDHPSKAWAFQHEVEHNDLLVIGTDGLFDNVSEKDILRVIKPYWSVSGNDKTLNDLSHVAEVISKFAFKLSLDPTYNSPFAKKAHQHYYDFRGGKSDDITVVVAQVQLTEKTSEKRSGDDGSGVSKTSASTQDKKKAA